MLALGKPGLCHKGKRKLFQHFDPEAIAKKNTATFLGQPSLILFSQHQFFITKNGQSDGFLLHLPISNLQTAWNKR